MDGALARAVEDLLHAGDVTEEIAVVIDAGVVFDVDSAQSDDQPPAKASLAPAFVSRPFLADVDGARLAEDAVGVVDRVVHGFDAVFTDDDGADARVLEVVEKLTHDSVEFADVLRDVRVVRGPSFWRQ